MQHEIQRVVSIFQNGLANATDPDLDLVARVFRWLLSAGRDYIDEAQTAVQERFLLGPDETKRVITGFFGHLRGQPGTAIAEAREDQSLERITLLLLEHIHANMLKDRAA